MSCTYEEGKPALMQVLALLKYDLRKNIFSDFSINPIQDLNFLRQMIEDDNQFLEV